MKVYTIQHINVLNKLLKKGEYRTDRRFICFENFKPFYKWYVDQAKKRIKGWTEDRPVWVWDYRPDLRNWKNTISDKKDSVSKYVLLELEIPEDEILLSNFDLWHFVLNKRYIPNSKKRKSSKKEMKKSWELCLLTSKRDLRPIIKQIGKINYNAQGIIPSIKKSNLVSYKIFTVTNKRAKRRKTVSK